MNTTSLQTVSLLITEAIIKGNLNVLNELIHPNYRYTSPSESMQGIEQLKAYILALRSAFPDLEVEILEQFGQKDKVCTRIAVTGTHRGEFLGIDPTEKTVSIQGVIISHLREGLIAEEWELLDQLALLQQLGLTSTE